MSLLDSGISHLLHLPETLERIAALSAARGHDGHSFDVAPGGNASEKGIGSVPVDILETSKNYTFFFDVPGLTKSDIQVTLEEEKLLIIRSNGKSVTNNGAHPTVSEQSTPSNGAALNSAKEGSTSTNHPRIINEDPADSKSTNHEASSS